jgi:glycosyltransferase involved in cell wall biosynthesis
MKIIGFEPDYEEHLRREVARRGLTDHVLFVEPRGELYPLLPHVDLLVRPTASDGDALTIREAHALGVPTVVSDAAPRPSACTVFRSRDPDAFLHAVSRVLDDPDEARARARSAPLESGLAPVLAILEGALGRPTKAV